MAVAQDLREALRDAWRTPAQWGWPFETAALHTCGFLAVLMAAGAGAFGESWRRWEISSNGGAGTHPQQLCMGQRS
jgi:hypothetical protein